MTSTPGKRRRGRPKSENPLQTVGVRVHPNTISEIQYVIDAIKHFKEQFPDSPLPSNQSALLSTIIDQSIRVLYHNARSFNLLVEKCLNNGKYVSMNEINQILNPNQSDSRIFNSMYKAMQDKLLNR